MASRVNGSMGFCLVTVLGTVLGGCQSSSGGSSAASTSSVAAAGTSTASNVASGAITSLTTTPSLKGVPAATVAAGATYSFTPAASDPAGAALTFSIENKPNWATFNSATGSLVGVPAAQAVGSYGNIVISASNGADTVTLSPFAIAVVAAPAVTALSITGNPSGVANVGALYSFKPDSADGTSAKLSFSIDNKPAWATFNTSTGVLSGTPGPANVGVDADISIRATDGVHQAFLSAFAIQVQSAPADSVTLSWTPPTVNANGSPTTDLSGYRIYYGTSERAMDNVVTVDSASATTQVVSKLSSGTWYFAVTSVNSAQVESKLSAILPVSI